MDAPEIQQMHNQSLHEEKVSMECSLNKDMPFADCSRMHAAGVKSTHDGPSRPTPGKMSLCPYGTDVVYQTAGEHRGRGMHSNKIIDGTSKKYVTKDRF